MNRFLLLSATILTLFCARAAIGCEPDSLDEFVGYTLLEITAVPGEFEGGGYDKVIKLENGMLFEFTSYGSPYAYHPPVAVFAKHLTADELRKMKAARTPERGITLYKLLIEEEAYDVIRGK